jgi:hypothetical protein
MTTSNATQWIGLIGALGGVIATALFALVTATLNHRWQQTSRTEDREHAALKEKAEVRREAYTRYLAAMEVLDTCLDTLESGSGKSAAEYLEEMRKAEPVAFDEHDRAFVCAQLVASARVYDELEKYATLWGEQLVVALVSGNPRDIDSWRDLRRSLLEAMRADVTI